MALSLLRAFKWFGIISLAVLTSLLLAAYLYLHRGSRPWIETPFPAISDWNSLRITLSRGPCLGSCPFYSVSISGRGTMLFKGFVPTDDRPHANHEARVYRSKINETAVRALFAAFQKTQFYWLYDRYGSGAVDAPEYRIGISFDGQKKEVVDYVGHAGNMPKEVTELENMIDRVAGTSNFLTPAHYVPPAVEPPQVTLVTPQKPQLEPPKITIIGP